MTSGGNAADKRSEYALGVMSWYGMRFHGSVTARSLWVDRSRRVFLLWNIRKMAGRIYTPCCGWLGVLVQETLLGWERFGFRSTEVTSSKLPGLLRTSVHTPVSTWSKTYRAETLFSGRSEARSLHTSHR